MLERDTCPDAEASACGYHAHPQAVERAGNRSDTVGALE